MVVKIPGLFDTKDSMELPKVIPAGKPIKVSLELKGLSEDGMYFEFVHNFYDHQGRNCATCEMMGGWIDLKERKLISLPKEFWDRLNLLQHTEDFRILTKEDTRRFGKLPKHIDPKLLWS